jgi:hypothetical protein
MPSVLEFSTFKHDMEDTNDLTAIPQESSDKTEQQTIDNDSE